MVPNPGRHCCYCCIVFYNVFCIAGWIACSCVGWIACGFPGKVKREAGETPARSRRCIGEIFQQSTGFCREGVEKFRIRSQKTCHIATPELYGR